MYDVWKGSVYDVCGRVVCVRCVWKGSVYDVWKGSVYDVCGRVVCTMCGRVVCTMCVEG